MPVNPVITKDKYSKGYTLVEALQWGATILRGFGAVGSIIAVLVGLSYCFDLPVILGILLLFAGAVMLVASFALHLVISALAQMLLAVLDTAVNTTIANQVESIPRMVARELIT